MSVIVWEQVSQSQCQTLQSSDDEAMNVYAYELDRESPTKKTNLDKLQSIRNHTQVQITHVNNDSYRIILIVIFYSNIIYTRAAVTCRIVIYHRSAML